MDLRVNTPPKGRRDSIIESAKGHLRELPRRSRQALRRVWPAERAPCLTHSVGIPENSADAARKLRIRQWLGKDVR
jgi:hypothetical protein